MTVINPQWKNKNIGDILTPTEINSIVGAVKNNAIELNNLIENTIPQINNKLNNVSGLNAYEIAVKNGYVGTEIQWLETLKGK